ncbi:ABC transporter substrate-binding protein [Chloroflexota bacterium]
MRAKSVLLVLAVVLAASSFIAACGPQAPPAEPPQASPASEQAAQESEEPTAAPEPPAPTRDELVIALGTNVSTPDNHKGTGLPALGASSQIGDVLVRLDEEGDVVPWLIESWEWTNDNKSLVLTVRDNVKMHDGNTMTAEDIRYSIERFRELAVGKAALNMVTEVTADDDRHVTLTTAAPFPPLLRTLAYTPLTMYSKAVAEEWGVDDFGPHAVGPGPYKLAEFKPGDQMVLEAFEDYWAGEPKIKRVVVRMMPEMSARILALEAGDVHLIDAVAPQEAARLEEVDGLTIINPPSAGLIRMYINTQKGPLTDKRVRQAIAYAIDREAIVKNLFLGLGEVGHSLAPSGTFGYTDEYDVYQYNPDKAKELLKEAGAEDLTFTLLHSPGRYLLSTEVVEAIKAQLDLVGIDMKIQDVEWGTLRDMTKSVTLEESEMEATFFWWRSINGDADSAIADFASQYWPPNGNNTPFFKNDEYDRLYAAEQVETDVAKREQQLKDMQAILMDELPGVVLYRQPNIWAAADDLDGININALSCLQPMHEVQFEE